MGYTGTEQSGPGRTLACNLHIPRPLRCLPDQPDTAPLSGQCFRLGTSNQGHTDRHIQGWCGLICYPNIRHRTSLGIDQHHRLEQGHPWHTYRQGKPISGAEWQREISKQQFWLAHTQACSTIRHLGRTPWQQRCSPQGEVLSGGSECQVA